MEEDKGRKSGAGAKLEGMSTCRRASNRRGKVLQ